LLAFSVIDAFKVFDTDNSGKITGADLKHVMTSIGEKLSAEQADAMMTEADVDASGKVDYEEFVKNMMVIYKHLSCLLAIPRPFLTDCL